VNSSRPAIACFFPQMNSSLTDLCCTCRYWGYVCWSWPLLRCIYQGMKNGLYVSQKTLKGFYA
jgi:hypothetical protein